MKSLRTLRDLLTSLYDQRNDALIRGDKTTHTEIQRQVVILERAYDEIAVLI